jgi:hypothetical protein
LFSRALFFLVFASILWGQTPWPDSVISVSYGENAGFGQDYFPLNILGPPDTSARPERPASSPEELLSLGYGGEIVLKFTDNEIYDGPGPDFTVFENPFLNLSDSSVFREAAIISVSRDGVEWRPLPFDTLTGEGLAGITPVHGDKNPLNPDSSGGDSFDLSVVGLNYARFIKITDAAEVFPDGGDIFSGDNGFDLDAVAAVHSREYTGVMDNRIKTDNFILISNYPNPFNPETDIRFSIPHAETVKIDIFDIRGGLAESFPPERMNAGAHNIRWNAADRSGGVYFVRVRAGKIRVTHKMILVK